MGSLIQSARLWVVSGLVIKGAGVVAIAAALVLGDGSITITWGG